MHLPRTMDRRRNGVAILLPNARNELLVCKRIGCRDMNNLYQFPGGAIECGESAVSAAKRELLEETGVDLPVSRFQILVMGVSACDGENLFVTQFYLAEPIVSVLDFQVENTEPKKHGPWCWMRPQEIRQRPIINLIPLALDAFEALL